MLKIKGPSIDPCGTPLSSSVHSLLVFPSLIHCLRSVCVSLDPRINLCKLAIATEMYSDIRVYRDGDGGGRWVGWRWGMWVMCHRVQTYVWMKWYSKNKSHTFFRIYNIFHIHEDHLHYITDMLFENIQRHYNNIDNTWGKGIYLKFATWARHWKLGFVMKPTFWSVKTKLASEQLSVLEQFPVYN